MKKWIWKELRSFGYAFRGLGLFFKTENHAKFHLAVTILVVGMGYYFGLSSREWALVIFAIGMVMVAEIFNTAIEKLADKLWVERDPKAAFVKDVAAAGVLIAAMVAIVIGAIVFVPYIFG